MGRLYRTMFNIFFKPMDPEVAHHLVYTGIAAAGRIPGLRWAVQRGLAPFSGPHTIVDAQPGAAVSAQEKVDGKPPTNGGVVTLGQQFPAPFGLAAGFDKDAGAVRGLAMLGFGFVEVGTITPLAQPGNDKPRLWRDVKHDALRNAMGFNNDGADAAATKLARLRRTKSGRAIKVGINIGKNKDTPPQYAASDFAKGAAVLAPYADYLVVNVSSPNTPGLRDLQAISSLRKILLATRAAADQATHGVNAELRGYLKTTSIGHRMRVGGGGIRRVPLLVKIAPDLPDADILAIANLVTELNLDGVVAVNTTINHDEGVGGKSGPLLKARGLAVVKLLRTALPSDKTIIGCGGIATAADAQEYLNAGANLVQGYTGFIYHGPLWPSRINKKLVGG